MQWGECLGECVCAGHGTLSGHFTPHEGDGATSFALAEVNSGNVGGYCSSEIDFKNRPMLQDKTFSDSMYASM